MMTSGSDKSVIGLLVLVTSGLLTSVKSRSVLDQISEDTDGERGQRNYVSEFDRTICGRPVIQPNVRPRVVGGEDAVPNSWPWTVSMRDMRDLSDWKGHYCGASIINNQWLVTAAHCHVEMDDSTMVLGAHYLDERATRYQKRVRVTYTVKHELYGELRGSGGGVTYDIRLVKLSHPVAFNAGIQPVCLPRRNQTFSAGKYCYTSGWGNTKWTPGGSTSPESLQQVRLPLRDTAECNQPQWYNGALDDVNLCAGYLEGGRGNCQGDSGGPLVCLDEDNRWVLVGVVSWGYECAMEIHPTLFAKVSMFTDWIQQQIALREAAEAGIPTP